MAVTLDVLPLSFMKTNAYCNTTTGRDYCSVGPKGTEKERGKKKQNVGAPHNM
jgi:hypothetical protein